MRKKKERKPQRKRSRKRAKPPSNFPREIIYIIAPDENPRPQYFWVYREEPDLYQLAAQWQCLTGEIILDPLLLTGEYGAWACEEIARPTVRRVMEIHSSVPPDTPVEVYLFGEFLEGEKAAIASFFPGVFFD